MGPSEQIQRGGREQLTPIATYSRVLPRQCYRTGLSQADGSNLGFGQGQLRLSPPGRGQCCVPPQQSTSGVTRSTQRAADRCGNRFSHALDGCVSGLPQSSVDTWLSVGRTRAVACGPMPLDIEEVQPGVLVSTTGWNFEAHVMAAISLASGYGSRSPSPPGRVGV